MTAVLSYQSSQREGLERWILGLTGCPDLQIPQVVCQGRPLLELSKPGVAQAKHLFILHKESTSRIGHAWGYGEGVMLWQWWIGVHIVPVSSRSNMRRAYKGHPRSDKIMLLNWRVPETTVLQWHPSLSSFCRFVDGIGWFPLQLGLLHISFKAKDRSLYFLHQPRKKTEKSIVEFHNTNSNKFCQLSWNYCKFMSDLGIWTINFERHKIHATPLRVTRDNFDQSRHRNGATMLRTIKKEVGNK